jgi:hypothetical protein
MSMGVVRAKEIVELLEDVQDRIDIESVHNLKIAKAIALVKYDAGI